MNPDSTDSTESTEDLAQRLAACEARERWLAEHFHALSQYLLVEQEEERRKLSRILHDNIGQSMTAAIINLQMGQMNGGQIDLDVLEQTCMTLSECLTEVREMSLNLRPSQLDELGLKLAVEAYLQRVLTGESEEYLFTAEGVPDKLEPQLETTAFRIIQDLVSLCHRLDQPFSLRIELSIQEKQLAMELEYAFTSAATPPAIESKQFLGIRERTAMLHGESHFALDGKLGCINIQLPL